MSAFGVFFVLVYSLDSDTKVKHFCIEIAPLAPILFIRFSKIINVIGNSKENLCSNARVFFVLFTILLFCSSFHLTKNSPVEEVVLRRITQTHTNLF